VRGSASPLSERATDSPLARSIVIVAPPEHVTAPAGTALRLTTNEATPRAAHAATTRRMALRRTDGGRTSAFRRARLRTSRLNPFPVLRRRSFAAQPLSRSLREPPFGSSMPTAPCPCCSPSRPRPSRRRPASDCVIRTSTVTASLPAAPLTVSVPSPPFTVSLPPARLIASLPAPPLKPPSDSAATDAARRFPFRRTLMTSIFPYSCSPRDAS
jgi:hypothetical protein